MKLKHIPSILLYIGLSFSCYSADLPSISKIFKTTFWTSLYQEGECEENIEALVSIAMDKKVNLKGAQILEIHDEGTWMAGMVSVHKAREAGRFIEPRRSSPGKHPGDMNWYIHTVLFVEGHIIDYDFTNEARVLPIYDYFEEMFLLENKKLDLNYRQKKMSGYTLTFYPVEEYMALRSQRRSIKPIAKNYKLTDFLPGFTKAQKRSH